MPRAGNTKNGKQPGYYIRRTPHGHTSPVAGNPTSLVPTTGTHTYIYTYTTTTQQHVGTFKAVLVPDGPNIHAGPPKVWGGVTYIVRRSRNCLSCVFKITFRENTYKKQKKLSCQQRAAGSRGLRIELDPESPTQRSN